MKYRELDTIGPHGVFSYGILYIHNMNTDTLYTNIISVLDGWEAIPGDFSFVE